STPRPWANRNLPLPIPGEGRKPVAQPLPDRRRWPVASPRGSKSFAPLDAIVSLRSCSRGQARSGQDWRGARNIGRWRGTSILVRAVLTAALGRRPTDDGFVRSNRGFCYDHWPEGRFGAFQVD